MNGLSSPLTRGFAIALLWLFFVPGTVLAQDVSVERVFAAVPIDQWIKAGPQAPIPWKVRVQSYGLSLHQRLLAHIDVELAGKELIKHPQGDRLVALVQVNDAGGHLFRDYSYVSLQEIPPQFKKLKVFLNSNFFVLPGDYKVAVALFDDRSGEHNLMEAPLHVDPLKDDPLSGSWSEGSFHGRAPRSEYELVQIGTPKSPTVKHI